MQSRSCVRVCRSVRSVREQRHKGVLSACLSYSAETPAYQWCSHDFGGWVFSLPLTQPENSLADMGFVSMVILNSINLPIKLKHHSTCLSIYLWVLYSLSTCWFLYQVVLFTINLWSSWESGILMPSSFVRFTQDHSGYGGGGLLWFHLDCMIFFLFLYRMSFPIAIHALIPADIRSDCGRQCNFY